MDTRGLRRLRARQDEAGSNHHSSRGRHTPHSAKTLQSRDNTPVFKEMEACAARGHRGAELGGFSQRTSCSAFLQAQRRSSRAIPPQPGPFLLTAFGAQLVPLSADLLFLGHRGALAITDSARCCPTSKAAKTRGETLRDSLGGGSAPRSQNAGNGRDPRSLPAIPQCGGSHAGSSPPVAGSPPWGKALLLPKSNSQASPATHKQDIALVLQ